MQCLCSAFHNVPIRFISNRIYLKKNHFFRNKDLQLFDYNDINQVQNSDIYKQHATVLYDDSNKEFSRDDTDTDDSMVENGDDDDSQEESMDNDVLMYSVSTGEGNKASRVWRETLIDLKRLAPIHFFGSMFRNYSLFPSKSLIEE